ncbi:MAG: hypothetical protein IT200_03715 [Thermoleophilia bacterium]|nr:hypothetical protein [Thermoleophilia bacterium]
MPPRRPDRRPPHPAAGLLLLLGATVAVGGGLGSLVLGGGDATGGTSALLAAAPPPVVTPAVPLPVAGAEPGDTPQDAAPAPLEETAPATAPAATTATAPPPPGPELPGRDGTTPSQRPAPEPEPAPATTAPAPETPPAATTPGTTTTAAPPESPPLTPYVPPPTAVIPAGVLPDAAGARGVLRAQRAAAGTGSQEAADITWLLELDRRYVTAGAPDGRRATIARALRANAWWYASRRSPARRVILRDPDGMILTYREGHGFMMNPVATTGRWRGLNDDRTPEELAEPLLQMGVLRGGGDTSMVWEYYDVPADPPAIRPGVSGMAQSRLVELLSTAYRRTGRTRFAEAAALALEGLARSVDGGGATSMVRLDGWDAAHPWYVERAYPGEDPWTGAALNGFMVTLLSLRNAGNRLTQAPEAPEAAVGTGTAAATPPPPDPVAGRAARRARQLADRGAETLRDALPAHDLGDWSLYGLLTPGRPRGTYRADLNYHCYHVFLLRALARSYPDLGFAATADRWQGYVDARGLECPPR